MLPQELVDDIIDHLHDDIPALSRCSLVSHAWRPRSLSHLFARLSLKATPTASAPELCRRLYRVLSASPAIGTYIRDLDVLEGSQLGAQVPPHAVLTASPARLWLTHDRTLPRILRALSHLRRLHLAAQSATIHWPRLPPAARAAIRHVLSTPSLTHLRLAFCNFASHDDLASLLACCTALQHLALANISFAHPPRHLPDLHEHDGPARSRLLSLTVEHVSSAPFGEWLLGPDSSIDLTSLRDLRIALFNDTNYVKSLVARTGLSLHHFAFKMGESLPHPFDLSINPNLRSIKLTLEDPAVALSWVTAVLSHTSTPNALSTICLEFYTPLKDVPDQWTALDDRFASEDFPALTSVEVGLFALPSSAEYVNVVRAWPRLKARGVVCFYRLGLKAKSKIDDRAVAPCMRRVL